MGKRYTQLKGIRLEDVLSLNEGSFKAECIRLLVKRGFIEEEKQTWEKITLKDLHRIRPGTILKRELYIVAHGRPVKVEERIIHATSDPYWNPHHILVYREESASGDQRESSINDLFKGDVYIRV